MTEYTMTTRTDLPFAEATARVKEMLGAQGFGVLTEIDLRATFKAKLDADTADHVVLGACRPQLAHEAVQADPSIAALLPCNVVVRDAGDHRVVEAFDPAVMISMMEDAPQVLRDVAADARVRLEAAVGAL
ncbi:DUF302 domain-containing protein [Aeromicrobium halocynthiae]|uniref:DUF302 domain-containing protein n=1 Tax=Aeromicrobium halocynthiae TaxID=560557 RepID=A0ABP5HPG0_9ACTN